MHPLGPLTSLSTALAPTPTPALTLTPTAATDAYVVPAHAPPLPALSALPAPLRAETYVYAGPLRGLSAELWSYDAFVRESAWKWVGRGAHDDNYAEVDQRRQMGGRTLRTEAAGEGEGENGEHAAVVEVQG